MHLLATSSASIDDLVEPVDLRQPPGDIVILSFADSDLAGLAVAWAEQRDILPTVGLPICGTCGIRSRSIFGSSAWDSTPRSWWSACWEVWIGGATVSNGCRRWRASAPSPLHSCPARTAMILAFPTHRRCRTTSSTPCCAFSARVGRKIWDRCSGGLRNIQARTSMSARAASAAAYGRIYVRRRCRRPRSTGRRPVGAIGRESRSCSIARCCFGRQAPIDALCRALAERGLAPAPLVVPSLKDRDDGRVRARRARAARACGDRDDDGVRRGGGCGRADAIRRHRCAGAAGRDRDHQARGLDAKSARPRARRPRHARRPARARWADTARCGGLQRTAPGPGWPLLQRACKCAGGGPDRDAGRSHCGLGAAAIHAARRAAGGRCCCPITPVRPAAPVTPWASMFPPA